MIEMSTDQLPVPPGADLQLTRDDVWRGLVWKAEVPMAFAVQIVDCVILQRFDDGFLREIQSLTPTGEVERAQERIIMAPQESMTFLRLSGSSVGRVVNEIGERPSGELFMQFHFILAVAGLSHGSPAEHAYRTGITDTYLSTWNSVLVALREMKRTGLDPFAHLLNATAAA